MYLSTLVGILEGFEINNIVVRAEFLRIMHSRVLVIWYNLS